MRRGWRTFPCQTLAVQAPVVEPHDGMRFHESRGVRGGDHYLGLGIAQHRVEARLRQIRVER